jgi:hypothetical protein
MVPPRRHARRNNNRRSWSAGCNTQHGELSIVARRQKARTFDKWKKHDRTEQEPPWMATLALSDASMPRGGKLGKLVGATALGFEMRDVPHHIKRKMQGHIRRWHNAPDKDNKKRKGSRQTPPHTRQQGEAWNAECRLGNGRGRSRRRSRRSRVEVGTEASRRVDARAARAMG